MITKWLFNFAFRKRRVLAEFVLLGLEELAEHTDNDVDNKMVAHMKKLLRV